MGRKLVSGNIAKECDDCKGDHYYVYYTATEVFEGVADEGSPSAYLSAGRSLLFQGGNLNNLQSVISAGADINVSAEFFSNQGALNGTIERVRRFYTGRRTDGDIYRYDSGQMRPYNLNNNPDYMEYIFYGGMVGWPLWDENPYYDPDNLLELPEVLFTFNLVSDVEIVTSGSTSNAAVVQAGGNVVINATQSLENSVILESATVQGGANRTAATNGTGTGKSLVVVLNSQLPPDLSQQQVNPLTLPGFTLPSGENGLFRLSGQSGTTAQAQQGTAQQDWSLSIASIGQAQRQQASIAGQASEIRLGERQDVLASSLGLNVADRQQGSSAQARSVTAAAGQLAALDSLTPLARQPDGTPAAQASTLQLAGDDLSAGAAVQLEGPGDTRPARQGDGVRLAEDTLGNAGELAFENLPGGDQPVRQTPSVRLDDPVLAVAPALPTVDNVPAPTHKYLVETNPALTELKQFMSSDYLLGNLGYDPDQAQKRLGDGLYEQRLVREAIVARTGQRFLDGLSSDEAMFRYLMDNAIASKDALGLSLGVTLSAEQVAALTHDIVWLEEYEVNGERVLVPVLYLAQAEGRLAPNGALIQGRDLTLISGGELLNQGTLRASGELSASAVDIDNSGLMEAGQRLELLAEDSIRNAQGGIIAGRDVSLSAREGDILNERSVTLHDVRNGNQSRLDSFVDSAARIEAGNSLELLAGRDLANLGGVLASAGELSISAGRDVTLSSVEERFEQSRGSHFLDERTTQLGGEISAGRDIEIGAGRDLSVVASRVEAGGDIALAAGRDVLLASAADETHSYSKSKKVTRQEDHVSQQATEIIAGGSVEIAAVRDLTLVSSKVAANDEAYLVAGEELNLLAAQDYDYSLYQKKKKGSFGRKSLRRDETTDITHVGSEIATGGDLSLVSGGDQTYQAAKLTSDEDLILSSGGEIVFEGVKDLEQESHEKSKSSLAWQSAKGKGTTDETLVQSELVAQGALVIQAVEGLQIDIKEVNRQTVSQTIEAMVQADPELAWLKEMEQRGDIDWQRVKEVHDSFKYSSSGLGGAAALVIAIVVTYLTWGAGSAIAGSASSAAAGAGAGASTAAFAGSAAQAVFHAAVNSAAISTVNNRGDLGAVLKDVTSSDALKGYAVSAISGGMTGGLDGGLTVGNVGLRLAVNSALDTLVNGGSFKDNLVQAGINLAANALTGAIYEQVGDSLVGSGLSTKVAVHAIVGGLIAEAAGGDFKTGALAAGANEALLELVGDKLFPGDAHEQVIAMTSQLVGMTVAAAAGGDDKAQEKAGWVAQQAAIYNHELHRKNAENFAQGIQDACAQRPDLCGSGYQEVSQQELVHALQVTAAHGVGIENVNPEALRLVNQFLVMFSGTSDTLFSPTDSEQARIDVIDTVELIGAGISLASAAKSALKSGGGLLDSLKGLFGGGAKGFIPAERTGLNFEAKVISKSDGYIDIELSAGQKFDKTGAVVDSKFAQSDLVARYSPDGNLHIDWYGTTVTGKGVGTEMVSRAIESVGPDKIKTVSAQLGNTNLEAFRVAASTGLSREQAVWSTPLGKTMSSLGFKNVEVLGNSVKFLQ
ncbi:DUF637 domain-containing protein [Stutzerimonas kirkiae]|uniref:DUF637 domain-containing protein n=1 Tax=Stutzerimonas kirkiae TaxID=2211392 RepID=UPI0024182F62|nr:DUF637 domain-containing protein [Stutzerimonas kirkiae]